MEQSRLPYTDESDFTIVMALTKARLSKGAKSVRRAALVAQPTAVLDGTQSALIAGDNLHVLSDLAQNPAICGRVDLIYIDPPFATGRVFSQDNKLAYDDRLVDAEFLSFMKERLSLLHALLSPQGSIYVHLDQKMVHYVKVLMDEIFGQKNFVNEITRIKCNPKNFQRNAYGNVKDTILFYTKTDNHIWNEPRESYSDEALIRLFPRVDAHGRRYTTTPLHAPGETQDGPTGKPWKGIPAPKGRHWRYAPDVLTKLDKEGLIEWSKKGNPRLIKYADEQAKLGMKRQDLWTDFKDPMYPVYPTEKNLSMLEMIVKTSSRKDSLVLDAFHGSGTTLVAAERTGRKWIGIDIGGIATQVASKRLTELGAKFLKI